MKIIGPIFVSLLISYTAHAEMLPHMFVCESPAGDTYRIALIDSHSRRMEMAVYEAHGAASAMIGSAQPFYRVGENNKVELRSKANAINFDTTLEQFEKATPGQVIRAQLIKAKLVKNSDYNNEEFLEASTQPMTCTVQTK